jgi:hypothetical protein
MVNGRMQGGLGVSSLLLILITILLVLQLFVVVGVVGAQMPHPLHGNCLKVLNIKIICLRIVNSFHGVFFILCFNEVFILKEHHNLLL